jgi:hypothetical protein
MEILASAPANAGAAVRVNRSKRPAAPELSSPAKGLTLRRIRELMKKILALCLNDPEP